MSESLRELARVLAQNERIPRWKQLMQARISSSNSAIQKMEEADEGRKDPIYMQAIADTHSHIYGLTVALQMFEIEVER